MTIEVSFCIDCESRRDERELAELVGDFVRNLEAEHPYFKAASNVHLSDWKGIVSSAHNLNDAQSTDINDTDDDEGIEDAIY